MLLTTKLAEDGKRASCKIDFVWINNGDGTFVWYKRFTPKQVIYAPA
jgi:hypothetical protein